MKTRDLQTVIEAIRAQHERIDRLILTRPTLWWQRDREHAALSELQQEACEIFAAARGWRVARTEFSARQLATHCHGRSFPRDYVTRGDDPHHLDHSDHFRHPGRPARPAAIIAHLYDRDFEAHALWAEANDLRAELLPESWYYPGSTIAVVYTPAVARILNTDPARLRAHGAGIYCNARSKGEIA